MIHTFIPVFFVLNCFNYSVEHNIHDQSQASKEAKIGLYRNWMCEHYGREPKVFDQILIPDYYGDGI